MSLIRKENRDSYVVFLLFFVFHFFVLYGKAFLNMDFIGIGDGLIQYYPLRIFLGSELRNFSLPLWMPQQFLGISFLGLLQGGALYPLNWIFAITDSHIVYNFILVLHFVIAGQFTYLYLRNSGLNILPAFIGGLIFSGAGFLQDHRSHFSMQNAAALLPCLIYLFDRIRRELDIRLCFITAIVIAFQIFAGHFQMCIYSYVFLAYFIVYHFFIEAKDRRFRFIFLCVIAFFVGVIIASPQLYATKELSQFSLREKLSYYSFTSYSYPIDRIPSMIFPYLYGLRYTDAEYTCFSGIFALILSIVVCIKEWKNKTVRFMGIGLIIFFILALGKNTPLYRIMFYVPVYNLFRASARHFMTINFIIASLTAFGFNQIFYGEKEKTRKYLNLSLSIFIFIALVSYEGYFLFSNYISTVPQNSNIINIPAEFLQRQISIKHPAIYGPFLLLLIYITIIIIWKITKKDLLRNVLIGVFLFSEIIIFNSIYYYRLPPAKEVEHLKNSELIKYISDQKPVSGRTFFIPYMLYYRSLVENTRGLYSINGYDPFINNNYSYILGMGPSGETFEPLRLIRNNLVLSMLNTRYIVLDSTAEEGKKILKEIEDIKVAPQKTSPTISDPIPFTNKWEGQNFSPYPGGFKLKAKRNSLAIMNQRIKLKPNTNYIITIDAKVKSEPNDILFVDISHPEYNFMGQEMRFTLADKSSEFDTFQRIINSGDVPDTEVFFRVGTRSTRSYIVRNISIRELPDPVIAISEKITASKESSEKMYEKVKQIGDYLIYENRNNLDKLYFLSKLKKAKDIHEINNVFLTYQVNPAEEGLTCDKKAEKLIDKEFTKGTASVTAYQNKMIEIKASVPEGTGFLCLAEQYYPGWHAYIDGKETEVYEVNGLIRGIEVPAGEHKIVFEFKPILTIILLIISGMTLLLALIIYLILSFRKKSNRIN